MAKKSVIITEKNKDYCKTLAKTIENIAYRNGSRYSVWSDFIYMSAAALSQPVDFRQNREDKYLHIINSYDAETQKLFPELLAGLALFFENRNFDDTLGEVYTEMRLLNDKNGQIFTPYHICKFMAAITGDKESLTAEIEQKGYITVSDPCCGAGAMLIAFADNCTECGINYQDSVLFAAQDIDCSAAMMCYVQMSLLGMPGYVVIGNSLIPSDTYDTWYTPMYYLKGFNYRTQNIADTNTGIIESETTSGDVVTQSEPQKAIIPETDIDIALRETENGQFTFDFAS